jgi:thiamine-monophosphate kinase
MPSEFDFIDWIRSQSPAHERVVIPPGDDLAALKWNSDDLLLIGNDQVLDSVHFDSMIHSPRDIGRKVMNRNLSDCAAMAALPAAAVVTAALPRGTSLDYAKELYLGMKNAGAIFDCPIVGGDTAAWDGKLLLTLTILARSAGITPITRSGAKPGDRIYVTGPLGGSILGRHMTFTPRIREARDLAATGSVTSMIDLSDGLSRDLRHICRQSRVGAAITSSTIPIHGDAHALSARDSRTPLDHALNDGEDYELLFTASSPPRFGHRIGNITADLSLRDSDRQLPLAPAGWEHEF